MPHITYNTRLIFKDFSDKEKIQKMLRIAKFVWDECSKVKFEKKIKNSIVDLHAAFYREFRDKNPEIPCTIVCEVEQEILCAYRSIKSNKHKIDKPATKDRLSLRLGKNSQSYKKGVFSIISLEKRVKCQPYLYPKLQEYLSKYKICYPLILERNGDIWISLTFKIPETLAMGELALGIDLGCRINAATSEGKLYFDKKFNKEKRALRYLKRQLHSKSHTSKSAKRKLKILRRKEQNKTKNFTHHLTKKIIQDTKADTLVIENLKSIKVKKNRFQNKNRISQIPFNQFKTILTYKAPMYGKTVIEVSPAWTSQIDHRTGERDGLRQGRRYYSKSGVIYDSDINGAINIGLRSKLPVSQPSGLTYGQAVVERSIVGGSHLQSA